MSGGPWMVRRPVALQQQDIRELQLAKGAVATGIFILAERLGLPLDRIGRFYLAGAFGNNLSVRSGRRIGLLQFPENVMVPVGNAALLGAKMALFLPGMGEELFSSLLPRIKHVPLEQHPHFQDLFADAMAFPVAR
jgi:uncharacterized 2Fe-2S/4Fe-4S cluster protein (DUF4445 family)